MILFIYFNYEGKKGRGESGFPLSPPPMRVGIPLPTPKLNEMHGVGIWLSP